MKIDSRYEETFRDLDVYIPSLWLYEDNNNHRLLSFWPDNIPVVLPRHIDIFVGRSKSCEKDFDFFILKYAAVDNLLKKYAHPLSTPEYVVLSYETIPKELKIAVDGNLHEYKSECMISRDRVLDDCAWEDTEYDTLI